MTSQPSDLKDEKIITGYILDFFTGIGMVIGGLAVLLLSIFAVKGWEPVVLCSVLFLFCLSIGIWEIKSGIRGMKKIK